MSIRTIFHILTLTALVLLVFIPAFARQLPEARPAVAVRYAVPDGLPSGNCDSWATACTLQTALDAAASGDEIWVAQGVYTPTLRTDPGDARAATFSLAADVALYGGFYGNETSRSQRDWEAHLTVLSGDLDGNDLTDPYGVVTDTDNITGTNAYHVVFNENISGTAVMDGFTLTAGQANNIHAYFGHRGGGMLNNNSHPTLTNLIFRGNHGIYGGGMANYNGGSPTLTNITFADNTAASSGGGMLNRGSSPTLINITFRGNSTAYKPWDRYPPMIGGGGMCNYSSSPTLTNVVFSGNRTHFFGGGIFNSGSSPTLINVTLAGNSAALDGGEMHNEGGEPILTNVILWGDRIGSEIYYDSSMIISYSNIQGCGGSGAGWDTNLGTDGGGNIDADPHFVDANNDLRLQSAASPAIDAGDNTAIPGSITTDLAGSPRFVDILGVPDTGAGTPPIVDMGAYEYQYHPPLAVDDIYITDKNTPLTIPAPGILTNDGGDFLTATLDSDVTTGTLTLNADGSFVYIPTTDFTGTLTFTYYAANWQMASNTATVTILVPKHKILLPFIAK